MGLVDLARLAAAIALVALVGAGGALAQGDQGAQGQQDAFAESFTLEPGASATIGFEGFCYQYGEPFPAALSGPSGLAEGNIRSALALARSQGLTGSDQDALQVQYAIWQLQGQSNAPEGGELALRILNQTRAAPGPTTPQGTSLVDAVTSGQVSVSVTEFGPVGERVEIAPGVNDTFYGRGRMVVTNNSQETLTLYMPTGTIIAAVDAEEQDLVAYATSIEGEESGAPAQQATEAPTEAPPRAPPEAPPPAPTPAPPRTPTPAAPAPP
ncbi:MAG TPA: hypothetical protein PKD53_24295, partial [Chloroflexaceae bacterium]|nr:hypothetical protein [Chloroflexaceae bacterium]